MCSSHVFVYSTRHETMIHRWKKITLYENFPYFMGSSILYEYDCNDTDMTNYPYIVYMCIMTIEFSHSFYYPYFSIQCIILYHIITCFYIFMLCSYYYNLVMIMFLPNYYTLRWLGRPGRVWWISWLWLSRVSCCGAKKYHGRKDWKWKFGDNSDWLCFIDMILVMLHLIIHSISHVNSFSWL